MKKKKLKQKPRCMNISVQQRGFFIFIFSINAFALSGLALLILLRLHDYLEVVATLQYHVLQEV